MEAQTNSNPGPETGAISRSSRRTTATWSVPQNPQMNQTLDDTIKSIEEKKNSKKDSKKNKKKQAQAANQTNRACPLSTSTPYTHRAAG